MLHLNLKDRFLGNVRGDILAGITCGIVALPLALGFGVASGLENGAAAGIYGAFAVGLFAALFGGTPTQISGPTGPMTVVVAGLVGSLTGDPRWIFMCVCLAGLVQLVLGMLRIGSYINYIPYPVISGFMSGIGVIIIILQMAQLVGHKPEPGTVAAIQAIPRDFQNINPTSLVLGLGTIALIYLSPRLTKVVPATLIALCVMTIASVVLPMDVPRIGAIPRGLPTIRLPEFDFANIRLILAPALLLGVVGALDSLLTSLVADAMTKTRHKSDQELVGQGLGNVFAGLIGGLPGAGATMRTVVNIRSGGKTRLAGVVHALFLLAVLLVVAPVAEQIPMSVLAGILITVGIGIIDLKGLRHVLRAPRGDSVIMLAVLGLTVFVDLLWAVAAGMVMAAMVLLKRLSDVDPATHSPLVDIAAHRPWIPPLDVPERVAAGIYVVELHGALFFGNAGPLQRKLAGLRGRNVEALVLHMGDMRYIDQSGAYALEELLDSIQGARTEVFLAELREEPAELLARLGVVPGKLAMDRVFASAAEAIAAATAHVHELHDRQAS